LSIFYYNPIHELHWWNEDSYAVFEKSHLLVLVLLVLMYLRNFTLLKLFIDVLYLVEVFSLTNFSNTISMKKTRQSTTLLWKHNLICLIILKE
jgi:TRAP-type C4-dicarboxylate transport system permease small subunit